MHSCTIQQTSESCLPGLPSYASKWDKWWRLVKKRMILNDDLIETNRCFRSHSAKIIEKKRHANSPYSFVIHPFSTFTVQRENVMCLVWLIALCTDTFSIAFKAFVKEMYSWYWLTIIIDAIVFLNILIIFYTGYFIPTTKDIVLNPAQIRWNYLKTYFVFDLLSVVPFKFIAVEFIKPKSIDDVYRSRILCVGFLKFMRFVRIKTMLQSLGRLCVSLKMDPAAVNCFLVFLLMFFVIHWSACAVYSIPLMVYTAEGLPNQSWIHVANIGPKNKLSMNEVFFPSLMVATTHFYGSTAGTYPVELTLEKCICTAILMCGFFYVWILLAHILQLFGVINVAESKYDSLIDEVELYSRARKVPNEMQRRLKTYYKYKFNKRFFEEEEILDTLSDHLRYEILLYNSRRVLENTKAFQNLPRRVIGGLIANFNTEVYLQNDVILKHDHPPLEMFFIVCGTVAVFLPTGEEITHHEDGDFFGTVLPKKIPVSVVAAETSKVFKVTKAQYQKIFRLEKNIGEKMNKLQIEKQEEYTYLAETAVKKQDQITTVVSELRKGNILESLRLR